MMRQVRRLCIVCTMAVVSACHSNALEREFFNQPLGDRIERLRQLPLEEQYEIFRYGNDVIHPPLMDLADPIAERGATAVPFLIRQLKIEQDDLATRDILLIFNRMARLKAYDVRADKVLMETLSANVAKMRDDGWRHIAQRSLDEIKNP